MKTFPYFLIMDVTIPVNTTATVFVPVAAKPGGDGPAKSADVVQESGQPAAKAQGVKFLSQAVGSGSGVIRQRGHLHVAIQARLKAGD